MRTIECLVRQFVPNIDISGRFESIHVTILTPFPILSFLKCWWSRHGVETSYSCSTVLFANSQHPFHAFLRMTSPCHKTKRSPSRAITPNQVTFLSVAPAEIRDSNIFLSLSINTFVRFAFTLSASQEHVIKKRRRLVWINELHQFLPHRTEVLLSSSHYMSSTSKDKNRPCFRRANRLSQLDTCSRPKSL